ncbi:MAG: hypothetical protein JSW04_08610 [Desulfobacterales bacterium]|nr:MAG: hypothetical protein JSV38_04010 [Desulfobacterales bacterium]UCD88526.1 MAG: hypothetical protein JSW04_08610 [Desulfobacterales bacterium]
MHTDRVLRQIETIILRIVKDLKKQEETTSEKINALSKVINSYSRLLERSKVEDKEHIDIPRGNKTRNLSRN